jgi:xanthine/CO dehydrogenase XdhC/CoxF family maturation factor
LFVQVFNRPLRMIVVGGVHIAQALVPIAITTGFQVTVVDPRTAFASELRFPGTQLDHQWPDEALEGLDLARGTARQTSATGLRRRHPGSNSRPRRARHTCPIDSGDRCCDCRRNHTRVT